MKRLLIIGMALMTLLFSCSSNDEPSNEPNTGAEASAISKNISGKYKAAWESLGQTENYEFTFNPYSTPQKHNITISGVDKTVTIYGKSVESHYFNDHQLEATKNYLYSIEIPYSGAQARIVFYNYSDNDFIYGDYYPYEIKNVSASSFEMMIDGSYRKFTK